MRYCEIAPDPALSQWVTYHWKFEVPPQPVPLAPIEHQTLADGGCSLVLIRQPYFAGVRLLGPHTKSFQQTVFPGSIYWGIRFHPWVDFQAPWPAKSNLRDTTAPAPGDLAGFFAPLLNERFQPGFVDKGQVEATIRRALTAHPLSGNQLVRFICLSLATGKPISAVAAEVPASIRVIQKTFKQVTALTMKQYANTVRQRKVWEKLLDPSVDTLDAILTQGYFDQAHFINECRRMMQASPRAIRQHHGQIDLDLLG